MFGIGGSVVSALLGSVSGIVGHWFKDKEARDKRKHEAQMFDLQMKRDELNSKLALAEIEANLKVTEVQMEGNLLIEESKDFNKVVATLNKNMLPTSALEIMLNGWWVSKFFGGCLAFTFGLVDIIRGLVRPVLTIGAFVAVGYIARLFALDYEYFTEEEKYILLATLIDAVIYVLTAATQFWFMDRAGARDFRKKH